MHNDKVPSRTAEMGINYFKRELKAFGVKGKSYNKLVKAYKKRAWMEIEGAIKAHGGDPSRIGPSRPTYGKKIKVTLAGDQFEYEVKVRNGKE